MIGNLYSGARAGVKVESKWWWRLPIKKIQHITEYSMQCYIVQNWKEEIGKYIIWEFDLWYPDSSQFWWSDGQDTAKAQFKTSLAFSCKYISIIGLMKNYQYMPIYWHMDNMSVSFLWKGRVQSPFRTFDLDLESDDIIHPWKRALRLLSFQQACVC